MNVDVTAEPTARPEWLTRQSFPFTSRFVSVEGHRIHYIDEGAGPPLLFVGGGIWLFYFRDVIDQLRSDFRCIALDFPGVGLSGPANRQTVTLQGAGEILEGFIEELKLRDIAMAVHDLGGPIGLSVAARHPDWFRAFVVSNSFAWPLAEYKAIKGMLRFVGSGMFRTVNRTTNLLATFTATRMGVGRHLDSESRRAFKGGWRDRAQRDVTLAILAEAGRSDDWLGELEQAVSANLRDKPLLTVFGRKNDPFGWQDRYGSMFSTVSAVLINGNHFPMCDDPARYARAVVDWWKTVVAQPVRTRPT